MVIIAAILFLLLRKRNAVRRQQALLEYSTQPAWERRGLDGSQQNSLAEQVLHRTEKPTYFFYNPKYCVQITNIYSLRMQDSTPAKIDGLNGRFDKRMDLLIFL